MQGIHNSESKPDKMIHDIVMDAAHFTDCVLILNRYGFRLNRYNNKWSGLDTGWETFPETLDAVLRNRGSSQNKRVQELEQKIMMLEVKLERYMKNDEPCELETKEIRNGEITIHVYEDE